MKNSLILIALFVLFPATQWAQISYGGEPYDWAQKEIDDFHIQFLQFAEPDMQLIVEQDAISDREKDTPFRFGVENDVQITPDTHGTWMELQNGDRIWWLGVEAENAKSLSFHFDKFRLDKKAELFIWNADRTEFLGAFTYKNNKESKVLPVSILPDGKVVIEYRVPSGVEVGELSISMVIQGYRAIMNKSEETDRGPYGVSGICNVNINCPEGDEWQTEKKSVALIINGGSVQCSGALVNNTANDGTPYFLTANHCLGNPSNWVYLFNHESASCDGTSGPVLETISSGTLVANNSNSDFALIRLSESPPESYDVQYAGWDRTDTETVLGAVGIHHPRGDVKKISIEEGTPYHSFTDGSEVWYIDDWEKGVTEGGSSGSPLFDHNHRIIGQLLGGFAFCEGEDNNGQSDWYGRFGVSWDGESADTRLKDWLDPSNEGSFVLSGFPYESEIPDTDPGIFLAEEPPVLLCANTLSPEIIIINSGMEVLNELTIYYSINGWDEVVYEWIGILNPFEQIQVTLPAITMPSGFSEFHAYIELEEDQSSINNNVHATYQVTTENVEYFDLEIVLDEFGNETSWQILTDTDIQVFGGPYETDNEGLQISESFCLPEGCYLLAFFDSEGDGMCCDYGFGGYELYNSLEDLLVEGGEFGLFEQNEFCSENVSVNEIEEKTFQVYPNPVSGELRIRSKQTYSSIQIYDVAGREVFRSSSSEITNGTIDVSTFQVGSYLVVLQTGQGSKHTIFIKE